MPGGTPPPGGSSPDGSPTGEAAQPARGFVVTMRILSPLSTVKDLADTELKATLSSIAPSAMRPNLEYKIQNVEVRNYVRVGESSAYLTRLSNDYNGRMAAEKTVGQGDSSGSMGGSSGGFGAPPPPAGVVANAPFLDPITSEDVRNDYLVDLVFRVTLEPAPYSAAQPTPTASAQ